jgi:hypothetical protein
MQLCFVSVHGPRETYFVDEPRTIEELLGRKNRGSSPENREYGLGIRHADQAAPSIRKSWHYLRRQAAVARSL